MGYRRLRGSMIETYKFTHCLYATQNRLFTVDTKSVTRGHPYKLMKLRGETTIRRTFFTLEMLNIGINCKQMLKRQASMLSRID